MLCPFVLLLALSLLRHSVSISVLLALYTRQQVNGIKGDTGRRHKTAAERNKYSKYSLLQTPYRSSVNTDLLCRRSTYLFGFATNVGSAEGGHTGSQFTKEKQKKVGS